MLVEHALRVWQMNQFSKGASSVLPRIGSQVHSYNAGTGSSTPAADSPLPLP
ncbi:hypothetical protein C2845_PM15G06330 [Panicum miliaceum]|uniref:Uncharacterized protein n=1 Tax=Panicum miliaceum TaxID=4540 RepID=A0A3L6QDW0_PANMI|nr:hypothetical protein C2845_PM15G06330 [Panicum miliaceum]